MPSTPPQRLDCRGPRLGRPPSARGGRGRGLPRVSRVRSRARGHALRALGPDASSAPLVAHAPIELTAATRNGARPQVRRNPHATAGTSPSAIYPPRGPGSMGTSTACSRSAARGTTSSARSWVEASTTYAAAPSSCARSQFSAVTHQRSPGASPGNWYSGIGVIRSLPIRRWCSRNSDVTTAQIVWLPRSSGPVRQQPSR